MRKATRAIESARLLLDRGDTEGACNRAYYAMFDAALAALWAAGESPSVVFKTHKGLIVAFNKELVQKGAVDPMQGRALSTVQNLRLIADYEGEPPNPRDTGEALRLAEAFVSVMRALVEAAQ